MTVNIADWTDDDWATHEAHQLARDPDVPSCDGCGTRTYDLLPSLERPSADICIGCARREDERAGR